MRLAFKSQVEVVSSMASVFTKNARAWNVDNGGVDEVFPTLGVIVRGVPIQMILLSLGLVYGNYQMYYMYICIYRYTKGFEEQTP